MANLQTKVQKEALQTAIKSYVFKNSMLLLGQRAGVGSKVIDNIITGNFEEVTQLNMERIHKIVAKEAMAEVFKTTDCASMLNIKNAAVKYKQMIGCVGDTGTGKTFIAKKIAEGENVFYYNVHLIASARAFFSDLLANLRIPFSGNVGEMLERVARGFNNLENPVLIIDEADKMHRDIRSAIHTLRDRTKENMGIILVGMPSLKNDLIRGKETNKQGYAEFFRRVNIWHELGGLKPDEIKFILVHHGITDPATQKEFRHFTKFGDLVNEIMLNKQLNS